MTHLNKAIRLATIRKETVLSEQRNGEIIEGLRAFADWLEEHPGFPALTTPHVVYLHAYSPESAAQYAGHGLEFRESHADKYGLTMQCTFHPGLRVDLSLNGEFVKTQKVVRVHVPNDSARDVLRKLGGAK